MREYHEVRRELEGDAAVPYIGQARVLLGALKSDMQQGGLSQGVRKLDLPDGTAIKVQSIFGQDKIMIVAPAQVAPEQVGEKGEPKIPTLRGEEINPPLEFAALLTAIRACGEYSRWLVNGVSLVSRPYYWSQATGIVDVLDGAPGTTSTTYGTATAISGDGRTVVGHAFESTNRRAFKWTLDGGLEFLSVPYAWGVSHDGSEILTLLGNTRLCRLKDGTITEIVNNATITFEPMMSQDGNYVCGMVSGVARVWDRAGRTYTSPLTAASPQPWYVRNVADAGVAVLHRTGNQTALWNIHTGQITQFAGFLSGSYIGLSPDGRNVASRGLPDTQVAHWRDRDGQLHVLPPGTQQFVHSEAFCCDAMGGLVVIGGSAALENQLDNNAPNANDAFWIVRGGTVQLTRIAPHPASAALDGGFIRGITLGKAKTMTDPTDVVTGAALNAVLGY